MFKLIAFAILSICLICISWRSLHVRGSHGFYRFFAWEFILALFLLNVDAWIRNPFSFNQLASWFLLFVSIVPLVFGVQSLARKGKAEKHRQDEPGLLAFEKITTWMDSWRLINPLRQETNRSVISNGKQKEN